MGRWLVSRTAPSNLPRTCCVAKIARLRYVGKGRLPSEKRGWRWLLFNPFLAWHWTWPKENRVLCQKLQKRCTHSLGERSSRKRALSFHEGSPIRTSLSAGRAGNEEDEKQSHQSDCQG